MGKRKIREEIFDIKKEVPLEKIVFDFYHDKVSPATLLEELTIDIKSDPEEEN